MLIGAAVIRLLLSEMIGRLTATALLHLRAGRGVGRWDLGFAWRYILLLWVRVLRVFSALLLSLQLLPCLARRLPFHM